MRISHKHKFVFLANRRCGSNSIRDWLTPASDVIGLRPPVTRKQLEQFPFWDHMTAEDLQKQFNFHGWNWSEYYTFAMIRNPWDRVVSHYMRALEKEASPLHIYAKRAENFTAFVLDTDVQRILTQQRLIPFSPTGEILVDRLFKLETMAEELPQLIKDLGTPITENIPRLSTTQHGHYSDYYDDQTYEIVKKIYRDDIRVGEYEFE